MRNMLRGFTIRKIARFTFIARRSNAMSMAANRSVKNPSFIANFSRARTRYCSLNLNYEEPSDKRWNIYISFFESEIRRGYTLRARIPVRICRFQAVRSADARSSEMIILDAIIWIMRDASHRVEIRMARSQDNELRSKSAPSSPSFSH